jgi:hypothetical protein
LPSTTPFGLALGTDLPCADELNAGNLRFSARLIPTVVIATYAGKVFSTRSSLSAAVVASLAAGDAGPALSVRLRCCVECSSTIQTYV